LTVYVKISFIGIGCYYYSELTLTYELSYIVLVLKKSKQRGNDHFETCCILSIFHIVFFLILMEIFKPTRKLFLRSLNLKI